MYVCVGVLCVRACVLNDNCLTSLHLRHPTNVSKRTSERGQTKTRQTQSEVESEAKAEESQNETETETKETKRKGKKHQHKTCAMRGRGLPNRTRASERATHNKIKMVKQLTREMRVMRCV